MLGLGFVLTLIRPLFCALVTLVITKKKNLILLDCLVGENTYDHQIIFSFDLPKIIMIIIFPFMEIESKDRR